ncbi:pesticidal protein Cry7Aa [Candidatus Shapirobacteria bacterium CG08_land_8_20_14_0_20_39_18]|uniref:Pesticidal protein Cry7Aa n=1 Tax=Candidatus Shapirobacteria bacterium CG08_land_8_20_14_0_20_39_18 TaxID=1974883 RepID=A0A2M6XDD3_9BACT|nr:MAG: pesticidal protein Cry7Aa [Candidatus Shapirobacteria bacterium CG08_land_8_20_14_0_20_39_18]PIY64910.1 MAG: pesticidal protein Cry7Aa [Candidatus Shapirobacteria bacterium CG_4_10_14_0_8_um_filter_39_15]PJE68146.1 MAG: pesticidal protein Cry7Aa [Candidatus Shapirobacteria bacterium CG10_big_fil_rev_8_21_14_0_10_38_8]
MIDLKDEGIILESTNLPFEKKGVLNPAVIEKDDVTHMFYRAVSDQDISSIGCCQLKDNQVINRLDHPVIFPEFDYEKMGTEDPRITLLDGTYYLFYTAYDGKNALIAYATSPDLVNFTKQGLISPNLSYDLAEDIFRNTKVGGKYTMFEIYFREMAGQDVLLWEKDASLFPKKINGKYALIHRILPGIQIIYFDDFSQLHELSYWEEYLSQLDYNIILDPKYQFENRNVGGGCPPIETPEGWLIIYHAIQDTAAVEGKIYRAGAALLDLNDPTKVIGRLKEPLFGPKEEWEKKGVIHNVVFPTGAIINNNKLTIYYGAADTLIASKSLVLSELLDELKVNDI